MNQACRMAFTFLAASMFVGLSAHAQASPILVTFTVAADPADPLLGGTSANGSFTFDSSLIAPNVDLLDSSGLNVDSLTFSWGAHTWTTADADVTHVRFDATGNLVIIGLGGAPTGLTGVGGLTTDFLIAASTFGASGFIYASGGPIFTGTVVGFSATPAAVPEPASVVLLGTGGLGLLARIRRRYR